MRKLLDIVTLIVLCVPLYANENASGLTGSVNNERAHFHYQMFCQGCHSPEGTGAGSVPRLQGYIGNFLTFPEGREFLVRVPGSANSALDDTQLAEVLNWMIVAFGGASIPPNALPYTAAEVGHLRASPLNEVEDYRMQLLLKMADRQTD